MNDIRKHILRLAPLAVLVLVAAVLYLDGALRPPDRQPLQVACADLGGGCSVRLDGREVRLGTTGALRVLDPFQLWVRTEGARKVQASFSMEGMNMGPNLFTLRADAEGVFRGEITLPTCVSGSRRWVMTLDIDGSLLSVPFVTEL